MSSVHATDFAGRHSYLIYTVEPILHTFDRVVLPILDVLCLEDLAESTFPLLGHQTVLPHPSLCLNPAERFVSDLQLKQLDRQIQYDVHLSHRVLQSAAST